MKKFISLLVVIYVFFVSAKAVPESEPSKISVIVPVYNVENYLRPCMDSIVNQSFENLEIICINDGSTDNSYSILEEYKAKDHRIILVNQTNQGVSSARNRGIELSTGEYISFVDPDDYLEKDAFKIAASNLENGDVDILSWGYNPFPNPSAWYVNASSPANVIYKNDSVDAYFNGKGSVVVWNKLYRAEIIKKNLLLFNEKLEAAEDVEFNMMAFVYANNVKFISDKLYYYRIGREGSLTSISKGETSAKNQKILFEDVFSNWNKLNLLKDNGHKVLKFFINMSYNTLKRLEREGNSQRAKQYACEVLGIFWHYVDKNDVVQKLSSMAQGRLAYIQNLSNLAVE